MNKKNLSVVMAGAMLATSVAPVLAAETTTQKDYTVNNSNKGLLIKELRTLVNSKIFANVADNGTYAGKSVYYITTTSNGGEYDASNFDLLEKIIQDAPTGTVITVNDRGYREKDGKYYAYTDERVVTPGKFTKETLKVEYDYWKTHNSVNGTTYKDTEYPAVYSMEFDEETGVLTVKTRTVLENTEASRVVKTYKPGDDYVNFTKAINKAGEELAKDPGSDFITSKELEGFALHQDHITVVEKGDDIAEKKLYTITISDVDTSYNVTIDKLYDGLFLTEDGQKLLDTLKEYPKAFDADGNKGEVGKVKTDANGLYYFDIKITKGIANGKSEKTQITVTSNNKDQLELFRKWMYDRKAQVEVLAGDNRYETAVKVAKENASIEDVSRNGNIVLVNGNSLVDGLAAAPLASTVVNLGEGDKQAPILLTEANGIPKATKDYMKEVIKYQTVGTLDKVTVYLVGGESVISKSVENDLKEIGFRVVRAGGEDREATSLAVAELMKKDNNVNTKEAFLVGANGEADAMSIASVAARDKKPIIVESVHGISDDTLKYLQGYKQEDAKNVTIVGGESAVSKSTEDTLKDSKLSVKRVAGSNRQATNAKVMQLYYNNGDVQRFVVSKDGVNNKSELIDALTATSLAVKDNAPIVLGTNKLSNDQINAMELKAEKTGVYVYQVGYGVARDVVKTIADRVGLAK